MTNTGEQEGNGFELEAVWDVSRGMRLTSNATVLEPSLAPGLAIPDDLPMAPRALYLQATYRM